MGSPTSQRMGWTVVSACFILCVLSRQGTTGQQTNLLQNADFEEELQNTWKEIDSVISRTENHALTGSYSILVTNRSENNSGLRQDNLPLERGKNYVFEGYIKLLNDVSGKLWQKVKVPITFFRADDGEKFSYPLVMRSFCNASQGWIRLRGDIDAPLINVSKAKVAIKGPDPQVDFVVDNFTLTERPANPSWRAEADTNIERVRKANVTINVDTEVQDSKITIEASLKNHLFAFGSMLREDEILEDPDSPLMKLAYYLFNWATIQKVKWKQLDGDKLNQPDLSTAISAATVLRDRGFKLRAHTMFWNVKGNIPDEVINYIKTHTATENLAKLKEHLAYVLSQTNGMMSQWDLMNEHLAEHYYEESLLNPNVTKELFVYANDQSKDDTFFLNEFQCIVSGAHTEQLYDLAQEYLAQGYPLEGLGSQAHTKEMVRPNPNAIMIRTKRLGGLGLPLMITEFDIWWPNKVERADMMEDAVRAFFGSPDLMGVILWDFWNETQRYPDKELVSGPRTAPWVEEPGERWACLVKKEWTTKEAFHIDPAVSSASLSFRGFMGEYEVLVKKNGSTVQREVFTLEKEGTVWDLVVTNDTDTIAVPSETDYVPDCISHREEQVVGSYGLPVDNSALTCIRRSSTFEFDEATVTCQADEVMTGCMSYHKDKKWTKDGEKMEMDPTTGRPRCVAFNSQDTTTKVKAFARCCKASGLQCQYRSAGPSFPFDGAMAEARCADDEVALGCSSYSPFPDMDGVQPFTDSSGVIRSCRARSGPPVSSDPAKKSGVYVYSACCKVSPKQLNCTVEDSALSDIKSGNKTSVGCSGSAILTGCNAVSANSKIGGVQITNVDKCKAFLGDNLPPGSAGIRAQATCCTLV